MVYSRMESENGSSQPQFSTEGHHIDPVQQSLSDRCLLNGSPFTPGGLGHRNRQSDSSRRKQERQSRLSAVMVNRGLPAGSPAGISEIDQSC